MCQLTSSKLASSGDAIVTFRRRSPGRQHRAIHNWPWLWPRDLSYHVGIWVCLFVTSFCGIVAWGYCGGVCYLSISLCVYSSIYPYVWVWIWVRVCLILCMYIFMYVYSCVFMHEYVYMCIHGMRACKCAYVYLDMCLCVYARVWVMTHIFIYTYITRFYHYTSVI